MASSSACRAKPEEWPPLALKAFRPPAGASLPLSTSVASGMSCITLQVVCKCPDSDAVCHAGTLEQAEHSSAAESEAANICERHCMRIYHKWTHVKEAALLLQDDRLKR